jgi:hypothetical protein
MYPRSVPITSPTTSTHSAARVRGGIEPFLPIAPIGGLGFGACERELLLCWRLRLRLPAALAFGFTQLDIRLPFRQLVRAVAKQL